MTSGQAELLTRYICSHRFAQGAAMLEREPSLGASDFYVACACGELKFVEQALRDQPELARREGGVNGCSRWFTLVSHAFGGGEGGAPSSC